MKKPTADFYVSLAGNDAWSGRLPAPNRARDDGPFATVARAQKAVRARQDRTLPVTVMLRGGTYFLTKPLVFTPRDSGTAAAPVTYAAYPGEQPRLSAGFRLTGWQETTYASQRAWIAPAPKTVFHQLWVNDQRRERPRLPKSGLYDIPGLAPGTKAPKYNSGQTLFQVNPGEAQAWQNLADVEMVMFNLWSESRMPVVEIDEEKNLVRTYLRSVFRPLPSDDHSEQTARYHFENVGEALDTPGEWYLDRSAKRVIYLPLPGEKLATAELIAPRLPQVLRIEGDPAKPACVEHLHFRGLTFAHTEWRLSLEGLKPGDRCGTSQAAMNVPGALEAVGARFCRFDRCTVSHLGTYGMDFGRGSWGCVVDHCDLYDLGGGGIKLGTREVADGPTSGYHTVTDCNLGPGGLIFYSAIGVWVGQSPYNSVLHNDIHDMYYSAISVGWTWGYARSAAMGNEFAYNHLHDLGKGLLSDMGGIYTLGAQPGTTLHHNRIHDVVSYGYGGWGIYHDEGSANIVSEYNLVYRNKCDAFHQHYGRENILRHNLFACSREFLITRTREEDHLSFVIEGNVLLVCGEGLLGGRWDSADHFLFRRNLYWDALARPLEFGAPGVDFAAWQARGQDIESVIADPGFGDPDAVAFPLPADSPAYSLIAFEPFDLSTVGPRGSVGV